MSEQNLNEETPVLPDILENTQPVVIKPKKKTGLWIAGILLSVIIITALGGLAGYYAGLQNRKATEANNRLLATSLQYQLGVEDLIRGNYDFAKQRFEYVIQLDPSYPGVLEKMAELSIIMNATATPIPAPEVTPVPTLDTSGVEGLLNQAKQFMVGQDYDSVIAALDAMRKENPSFKTLEVDGLYYLALRNRGINKIQKYGKLESGIFDIVLMSRYGPIDKDARDASEWAGYYIYGASFYGIDWGRVIKDLKVVHENYPYLMDQSKVSATFRYWTALYKYGLQLWQANENKNACLASDYYVAAWALNQNIPAADIRELTRAQKLCTEQQAVPTESPLNNYPIFTGANLPDGLMGTVYAGQVYGTDPDGDAIIFSEISGTLAPYGLAMDGNGNISGTPNATGVSIPFTVQINDGKGGIATQDFTIHITG